MPTERDDPRFVEAAGTSAAVDALWRHGPGAALRPIIPGDGCVDVIVRRVASGAITAVVLASSVRAHEAFIGVNEEVLGVRLRLGWGGPLLARAELVAREASNRARSYGLEWPALESLVAEVLGSAEPPGIVQELLHFARESGGSSPLHGALVAEAGERRLQRAARQWIGISPKALLRLERVQAARASLRQGTPIAVVAAELGYADQPHLTREFREILGVTPRAVQPVGILQDQGRRGR